jgi:hypothetical protein
VPPDWVTEGGVTSLSTSDIFGFSVVGRRTAEHAGRDSPGSAVSDQTGAAIANYLPASVQLQRHSGLTLLEFLRRSGAPTGNDAIYLTDNTAVFGVTISATGLIKLWRTNPLAAPAWVQQ